MTAPSERLRGGLGRLVLTTLAFATVAPVALVALPLAALLLASRPRSAAEYAAIGLAGGPAIWWLLTPGDLPDQLVRASALFVTLAFTITTLQTRVSVTHRALHAVTLAGGAVVGLMMVLQTSWGEVRWWIAHRTGFAARWLMGALWSGSAATQDAAGTVHPLAQLQNWFAEVVPIVADFYPALLAVELMVGLALATAIYRRVAARPRGALPGPWRQFRFSDQLGWAAAIPLVVLLVPKLAAAKLAAANLLVVAAALYAARGFAVAAFGLHAAGAGGVFLWALMGIILIFLMPIVVAGAIVLGVLDAGLDFRRRWGTKTAE